MAALATKIEPVAPLKSTPRAASFLTYWRKYRDETDDITARAEQIALKDGRDLVCLNDVQAAWTRVVGALWCEGMERVEL